ncbi:hypothetical protein J7E25_01595 [Agromyces sp. ISL-38]|uniref:hypothetical protein n=1 Tax=Agromyces sp. ISL-38 TaxID=2819107 RepID=UPI001BE6EDF9|nr:hypothetical protein [Agromyces sp. ISL-38]MBT2497780.1 hypothetical protein [Agromyces sp. ISL-38]
MSDMTNGAVRSIEVDEFLVGLEHPLAAELAKMRERILAIAPANTVENVKWKAPNYAIGGVDRVTLGVDPRGRMRVVLHRGVKRVNADGFTFDDDTGLVAWPAPDRGVITLASGAEYSEHAVAITELVARWFSI